jgi:hypothetical protein
MQLKNLRGSYKSGKKIMVDRKTYKTYIKNKSIQMKPNTNFDLVYYSYDLL